MEQLTSPQLRSVCFALLDSVVGGRCAAYVAGPLDTGIAYYEGLLARGHARASVREANQLALTAFAQRVRARLRVPVIDPGILRVPGWTGPDYGSFFLEIIDRYVVQAWFADGWQYSGGATKEFLHCLRSDIPCYDADGAPIARATGISLISDAVAHVESLGLSCPKLRSRIQGTAAG